MEQHIYNVSEKINVLPVHQNSRPASIYNTFFKIFNIASNKSVLTFILQASSVIFQLANIRTHPWFIAWLGQ